MEWAAGALRFAFMPAEHEVGKFRFRFRLRDGREKNMGQEPPFIPILVLLGVLLGAQLGSAQVGAGLAHRHHHRHLDAAATINQREPGEAISALIGLAETLPAAAVSLQAANKSSTSEGSIAPIVAQNSGNQSEFQNQSQNRTGGASNGNEQDDRSLILGVIIASIVIFIIGSVGNAVVILVIMKFTRTETVTDIYILNLAFADLMFLTGLIFLVTTMFVSHWIFGNLMCKLYMASTSLNLFASSLLLVVMSFDRFLAVCHPIYAQRFRRIRTAKAICLCIWIVCLILMTPILIFAKINTENTCGIFWPEDTSFNCEVAFTLYAFAFGFALPLLLIACFYLCVIRRLRLAAQGQALVSSRRSRSRETTNKRIEHLVIGIICTYTICWLPYWTTQLWVSFTVRLDHIEAPVTGFYAFFLVASCLSYTNSAVNPILYAFLSDNFKRRCSEIIRSVARIRWCPALLVKQTSGGGGGKSHGATAGCHNHAHEHEHGHQQSHHPIDRNYSNHRYLMASNNHQQAATASTACYCEPTEALGTSYAFGADLDCQSTAAQLLGDLHLGDLNWQQQALEEEDTFYNSNSNSNHQFRAIKEEKSDKSQCQGV